MPPRTNSAVSTEAPSHNPGAQTRAVRPTSEAERARPRPTAPSFVPPASAMVSSPRHIGLCDRDQLRRPRSVRSGEKDASLRRPVTGDALPRLVGRVEGYAADGGAGFVIDLLLAFRVAAPRRHEEATLAIQPFLELCERIRLVSVRVAEVSGSLKEFGLVGAKSSRQLGSELLERN